MLSEDEKRRIYDASNGMGKFKNYIASKTVTLTANNYERLVTRSNDFWVIQVFDHESSMSNTFADTWEKLASKYYFMRFGRVDYRSQQRLIPMLPFKALEFPFIFVYHKDVYPEFVEKNASDTLSGRIVKTIKEAMPTTIRVIGARELERLLTEGDR